MGNKTLTERIGIVEREMIDAKKTLRDLIERLRQMEKIDTIQTSDITQIKNLLKNLDEKLDPVATFVTETKGGKKWMFGLLAVIGSAVSVIALYFKFNQT